jgi:pyridoxal phosphate enzyme (YggS family)
LSLKERIEAVEMRIKEACKRSGRDRDDVNVVAVTKYVSLETTVQVADSGYLHIGENRWQDVKPKWEAIGDRVTWHFLGHLQTNKVKDVVGRFSYIHSLDRPQLAEAIHRRAETLGAQVNCFIQLNVSGEESKYGMHPDDLFAFAEQLQRYPSIRVQGLMTMAPFEREAEDARPVFRGLRELRDELNVRGILDYPVRDLSMGMSNDYAVAIEEGATWIRLGSGLVGKE